MSVSASAGRIVSLDQFRGYTVAGMFVVNFLGHLALTHQVLKHNNTHFSYADSIMPGFLFICGLSYRMVLLRRVTDLGWSTAAWRIIRRSLSLILLSLMLYGFNESITTWNSTTGASARTFVALLLKAHLWEVLAIIGAVQLLILPVITASSRVRTAALLLCAVAHVLLSWSFNYDFVYGRPNWVDPLWGTVGKRAWDGGFFGLISWAEVMLAGSLAYDVIAHRRPRTAAVWLAGWGGLLMLAGYGLSCLATLYDVDSASPGHDKFAASPVLPPLEEAFGRDWRTLLAPPPFVPPPPASQRSLSYWMMDKRVVTQSFMAFSTGFTCALYALFVLACDAGSWSLGVFRTFGQNPLAAYVIHYLVARSILNVVPKDSPLWWVLIGLVTFLGITYLFVRFLERQGLYLRL